MFSVVRGYTLHYCSCSVSSLLLLAPEKKSANIILDYNLFILVVATSLTIASVIAINNFYDSKRI
jgi:4-hydroxybenzoate polyprenyltransferase